MLHQSGIAVFAVYLLFSCGRSCRLTTVVPVCSQPHFRLQAFSLCHHSNHTKISDTCCLAVALSFSANSLNPLFSDPSLQFRACRFATAYYLPTLKVNICITNTLSIWFWVVPIEVCLIFFSACSFLTQPDECECVFGCVYVCVCVCVVPFRWVFEQNWPKWKPSPLLYRYIGVCTALLQGNVIFKTNNEMIVSILLLKASGSNV